ncbi:MAG TPA: ThiF family adenylyltransferase [Polyangiaceae bacterium]|jgi:molybdopterin/thiamine biosynthesis adenylyltransferase|nr:ThiF family adenylyltransferase [Polyangiaceae bacterium]
MTVAGEHLRIGLALADDFPASLPKVYLLSQVSRDLPHVDSKNEVCVLSRDGVLHDVRMASGIVKEALARAQVVLEDGLLGRNTSDFLQEAEAYWHGEKSIVSTVEANNIPREVEAFYSRACDLIAVADSAKQLDALLPGVSGRPKRALYIPLDPHRTQALHPKWRAQWPSSLAADVDEETNALLQDVRVAKGQSTLIVLGVPRPDGGRALLGLFLDHFRQDDRLLCAVPRSVQRVTLDRLDAERIAERRPKSPANRVTIIGCGAIGGHVAHTVAWTGSPELVLVDPDRYTAGNTFRHVLGRHGWGTESKVAALKEQLTKALPNIAVTPLAITADQAFASSGELLRHSDVIVVAIGNPSVPLQLNDELAARRYKVPVIYTWLEPHGLGGHALLVRYDSTGCLRCLFPEENGLMNTADFAAPNQDFTKRELGCYGAFTPYGDIDARETAIAAVRLIEAALRDSPGTAILRSWRGDATALRAAGFQTSKRYDQFTGSGDEMLVPRKGCDTCGR